MPQLFIMLEDNTYTIVNCSRHDMASTIQQIYEYTENSAKIEIYE